MLIRRGYYMKALVTMDTERELEAVKDDLEVAEVLLDLAEQVFATPPVAIPDRLGGKGASGAELVSEEAPTPLSTCAGVAAQLMDSGHHSASAELAFAALRRADSLPSNLRTGLPIRAPSDVGLAADQVAAMPVARYFLGLARYALEQDEAGDATFKQLNDGVLPAALKPYVLYEMAGRAGSAEDFDLAVRYADEALADSANIPVMAKLRTKMLERQEEAEAQARFDAQRRQHLAAAESAQTPEEAIEQYAKLARLYLSGEDMQQAVATYMLIAEKHSDNDEAAPAALAEGIGLIESAGKEDSAPYIKTLKEKLMAAYPNSKEARKLMPDTGRAAE